MNRIRRALTALPTRLGFPLYIDGYKVYAPSNPWYIYREIFHFKDYHFDGLPQSPVIYDVGANIGLATFYFKHLRPDATIYAFEPSSETFRYLAVNTEHLDKVNLYKVAIAATAGEVELFAGGSGKASIVRGKGISETVRTEPLTFPEIDLLKMDIEGAEYSVIPDLHKRGILKNAKRVAIEIHGEPSGILSYFNDFRLIERNANVWKFVRKAI